MNLLYSVMDLVYGEFTVVCGSEWKGFDQRKTKLEAEGISHLGNWPERQKMLAAVDTKGPFLSRSEDSPCSMQFVYSYSENTLHRPLTERHAPQEK